MPLRFSLFVATLLVVGACARAAAPLPSPSPTQPTPLPAEPANAALFDAVDNADRVNCGETVEVVVEVWQGGKNRPLANLALSLSPGDHQATTDSQGRAVLGRLPGGDYRLALADPRFALMETRPIPADKSDRLLFRATVEEVGEGLSEVVVKGNKFRWCGALGEICGVPMANKDRLHVVIDGFLRGLPH